MRPGFKYKALCVAALSLLLLLAGCQPPRPDSDGYFPLSVLSKRGFARDEDYLRNLDGQVIRVKGFLDFDNIAVYPELLDRPADGWDVPRDGELSHFNLKARVSDEPGESVRVWFTGDRDRLLLLISRLRDIVEQDRRAAVIRVQARVQTFDAPMNFTRALGFVLWVDSPQWILVD